MFLPSPLKLEGYGISSFSFSTNKDYNPETGINYDGLKLKVDRDYKTNVDDPALHLVEMKISVKSKKKGDFPYIIDIELGGVFEAKATEKCPEEKLKGAVYINGASILYGVAREYIYMATCHNMCGPFMLPSISFAPDPKSSETQAKKKALPKSE